MALVPTLLAASALAQTPWDGEVGASWPETAVDVPVDGCAGLERSAQIDRLAAAMAAETDPAVRGIAQLSADTCFLRAYRSDATAPPDAASAWARVADAMRLVLSRHPDTALLAAARAQQAAQVRRWRRVPAADIARQAIAIDLSVWFIVDASGTAYVVVDRRIEHGLAHGARACPPSRDPREHCDPVGPVEGVSFEVNDTARVRIAPGARPTIVRHTLQRVGPLRRD